MKGVLWCNGVEYGCLLQLLFSECTLTLTFLFVFICQGTHTCMHTPPPPIEFSLLLPSNHVLQMPCTQSLFPLLFSINSHAIETHAYTLNPHFTILILNPSSFHHAVYHYPSSLLTLTFHIYSHLFTLHPIMLTITLHSSFYHAITYPSSHQALNYFPPGTVQS